MTGLQHDKSTPDPATIDQIEALFDKHFPEQGVREQRSFDERLAQLEREQADISAEVKRLRAIVDIHAQQDAFGGAIRPRDVSKQASGNALIEPRNTWRTGRPFPR